MTAKLPPLPSKDSVRTVGINRKLRKQHKRNYWHHQESYLDRNREKERVPVVFPIDLRAYREKRKTDGVLTKQSCGLTHVFSLNATS